MKLRVPMDSAARALGADEVVDALVAEAARRGQQIEVIRTGSRGMVWLEPLVEVEIDGIRHGYGPAGPEDSAAILDGTSARNGAIRVSISSTVGCGATWRIGVSSLRMSPVMPPGSLLNQ